MDEPNEAQDHRELYALLNLSPEASDEEIRRAYRQWAQVYHPDKYQAPHVFFFPCLCANSVIHFRLQFLHSFCFLLLPDEGYCYGELSANMRSV